jgi:hypothetical protein
LKKWVLLIVVLAGLLVLFAQRVLMTPDVTHYEAAPPQGGTP